MKYWKKLDINDVLIIGGGLIVAAGVWQIYQPAAFIVVGLALIWLGLPMRRK